MIVLSFNISETNSGPKKPELSRNPKYIDMRMDGVYPAKKSRFGKLSGKGNVKVCLLPYQRLFLLVFLVLHLFQYLFGFTLQIHFSLFLCETAVVMPGKCLDGATKQFEESHCTL